MYFDIKPTNVLRLTSCVAEYTVVRQIGEGSFSQVIKVRDANGRYFAAKKLTKAYQRQVLFVFDCQCLCLIHGVVPN